MKTVPSELACRRALELTKAALHGTVPDKNLFAGAGEKEWIELFELSAVQGVMALSLNGTLQLPKDLQPPFELKMRWVASMEVVEKRYRYCLETVEKLSARFKENNIRMLLFKGLSLSRLYPVPCTREFGDIDIFLCGKAREGDALLEQIADRKHSSKKNVNFSYRGTLIENHHTFLYHSILRGFQRSENLEKRLVTVLTKAGFMGEGEPAESNRTNGTLLFPPPDFDALYVSLHMLSHFPFGIALRHFCDLTVLFTAYKGKIDFSQYREALSEAGLSRVADAFVSLSVRYLGLKPEDAPPYQSDLALEDRIWNNVLSPPFFPLAIQKHTSFSIFIQKVRFLLSGYWKFELIYPGKYWKRILRSIFPARKSLTNHDIVNCEFI